MGRIKPGHGNNLIVTGSSTPDVPEHISKHRTCWLQLIAHLRIRNMKISKQKLRNIELTAPCLLGTYPCGKRSKRKAKCKSKISKQQKLDSGTFECYMENLWSSFPDDKKACFTYLDSLWFNLYKKASNREKVLTWIKKKEIFTKKYVIVPIVCWSHWNLLIFCHFGESLQSKTKTPCMLLLDSLQKTGPRRIEPVIRKFVLDIYRAEGRPETKELISQIPFFVPEVPQQRNGVDCGKFVLYYINLFLEGAPENFNIKGYPYFMRKNWFSPEVVERFWQRLGSL